MNRLVIVGALALLLAGCSAAPTPAFSPYPGISANKIASHISGCRDIHSSNVGDGTKSGLSSAATCTLDGYSVYVTSWKTVDAADISGLFSGDNGYQFYWASGSAWDAFINDDPTPRLQVTNDGGALLARSSAGKAPVIDLDAAKSVAVEIAGALHGKTQHAP
jgi:hypothetical protein